MYNNFHKVLYFSLRTCCISACLSLYRPINGAEKKAGSCSVVHCDPDKREVYIKEKPGIYPLTKTFTFDHVFPPSSKQIDVYRAMVVPVVEEVLMGYNCTIFACVLNFVVLCLSFILRIFMHALTNVVKRF